MDDPRSPTIAHGSARTDRCGGGGSRLRAPSLWGNHQSAAGNSWKDRFGQPEEGVRRRPRIRERKQGEETGRSAHDIMAVVLSLPREVDLRLQVQPAAVGIYGCRTYGWIAGV